MIKHVVPTSFLQNLRSINEGLYVLYNEMFERFQVMHRDPRTGLIRHVLLVENEDGSFRPCDNRTLDYLKDKVSWDTIARFPDVRDLGRYFLENRSKVKLEKEEKRKMYRELLNKETRRYWKAAIENMQRGIISGPARTKEIVISAPGLSPKSSVGKKEIGLFD